MNYSITLTHATVVHQINWCFEKTLCTLANWKKPKNKTNNTPFSTIFQILSSKDCNYGMSVLLYTIRYYTVEKNSQDIAEITCFKLSQNFMYDAVNAPNIKK